MKLMNFLLTICLIQAIHFQAWGLQSSDSLLIHKSKIWYEEKLRENPQTKAFEREFNWRWEKAEVLENREVVIAIDRLGDNQVLYPWTRLIVTFDKKEDIVNTEILQIVPKKRIEGKLNQIVLRRRSEYIEGFSGQLLFMNMFPWSLDKESIHFYQGHIDKSTNSISNYEIPTLLDGTSPQLVLHLKHLRRLSGYSIFEFLVRKDGSVDSIQIISSYYAGGGLDSLVRNIDEKDKKLISGFRFKALQNDTWVQCKVYTQYFNNRTGDPLRYKETADHFRNFDYGLKELHQNELDTHFRNSNGRTLDFIVRAGKVIFAPTYLWGIT